jgi:hypothetical protein
VIGEIRGELNEKGTKPPEIETIPPTMLPTRNLI